MHNFKTHILIPKFYYLDYKTVKVKNKKQKETVVKVPTICFTSTLIICPPQRCGTWAGRDSTRAIENCLDLYHNIVIVLTIHIAKYSITALASSLDNVTLRKKTMSKIQDGPVPLDDNLKSLTKEIRAMRLDLDSFSIDVSSRLETIVYALQETAKRIDVLEIKPESLERKNSDLEVMVLEDRVATTT
ncbi:hypothetical protein EVAR_90167_1 [Eumeta japonica]|uniref:Uncharacterized protein n=1 Tax=Eumeta variegata TaxID=151549 RepID=A0A4C1WUD4_EUMVA|nr:hypothetical protein EVAR_90167_1 [Eumeta japonica]